METLGNGRILDIREFLTKNKTERLNQIEAEQQSPKNETEIRTVSQKQNYTFLSQHTQTGGATAQNMDQTKRGGNTAGPHSTPLGNSAARNSTHLMSGLN